MLINSTILKKRKTKYEINQPVEDEPPTPCLKYNKMKKQFYRVRQLADQRVGRAEKTDLLTEELQHVENSVEKMKIACTDTNKRLLACMQSSGPELDKRKKKLNQLHLGTGMIDGANQLGDASLLGGVFKTVGEAQSAIAGELAACELEVDEQVLAPFQKMLEVDAPNISLTKKKLAKAGLDMDSNKTRWLNAVKVTHNAKTNMTEALAKAELLKGEFEDTSALFTGLQDTLATEMFTFVAGEHSYAQSVVKLLEAQMRYHEASLKVLKECLPNVTRQLDDSMFRPVFGCSLPTHLNVTGREIAVVIEECVLFLLENAMDEQGLFRLAGSSSKIKKLKMALDAGVCCLEDFAYEIHAVTGVLKLYLRELPEPILTFELYDDLIAASNIQERDEKLQALWTLINRLPKVNRTNLSYLICFLAKLAENSEENKMIPSNIAIVIGPNLMWKEGEGGVTVQHTYNISHICELIIENSNYFFPEGCDFTRRQISEEKLEVLSNRYISEAAAPPVETLTGAGNLLNEVSKKLGWKDGKEVTSPDTANCPISPQGYYNPLASQYDVDLEYVEIHPEKQPGTEKPAPPNGEKPPPKPKRTGSEKVKPYGLPPAPPTNDDGVPRSTSNASEEGNTSTETVKGHRRNNSNGPPRRPAPPVPPGGPATAQRRLPPDGPPKHRPPEVPLSPKPRVPPQKPAKPDPPPNNASPTLKRLAEDR